MKILFLHQNFPAQFKNLVPALIKIGHEVKAIGLKKGYISQSNPIVNYRISRGNTEGIPPLILDFETKVIRAHAVAGEMESLKKSGFYPDLVVGHPGWGETLFVRNIFPNAMQLHYCEYFYSIKGADVDFDPEFPIRSNESKHRIYLKNTNTLLALNEMDCGISPTHWQKSLYPRVYQDKIEVISDGIDTELAKPGPVDQHAIISQKSIPDLDLNSLSGKEVITFVSRNLEPYRGYHSFMRSLPKIQKDRPDSIVLIIGGDGTSYGASPNNGKSWKDALLEELGPKIDISRIYFLGHIPYRQYLNVLKISSCHIYLTYPFVLSWSCLEAMSSGCVVVGSKTKPVEEVIIDGENGLLVDFFNYDEIAKRVINVLERPNGYLKIREAARNTIVNKYSLKKIALPHQIDYIERLVK